MMKRAIVVGISALALCAPAFAAPNVTNPTQKGSLLIWPDIRVDGAWNTLIRLQNDGSQDVEVICYWMDGNKNRVDFVVTSTRSQPFWFDALTGNGTDRVNRFPGGPANGFNNPLLGPAALPNPAGLGGPQTGAYGKGLLACWAVDAGEQNHVKWNHLSGTATVYHPAAGAYEYNASAFFIPTGLDLQPVGTSGVRNLNGVEYDSCPLYQMGQFSPQGAVEPLNPEPGVVPLSVSWNRLTLVGCSLDFGQDWTAVYTKWHFDVWNEDEVKFTGAFECADSWHEIDLFTPGTVPVERTATAFEDGLDAGANNFQSATLGTFAARYRVQGIKSTQCEREAATGQPAIVTQAVGVLAVQSTSVAPGMSGTTLAAAGKFNGKIG
ncbi:MAG: hypothetical protein AB7I50_01660, partial [Vicinamibacterales bacterium]